jgi:hypothetical protein
MSRGEFPKGTLRENELYHRFLLFENFRKKTIIKGYPPIVLLYYNIL